MCLSFAVKGTWPVYFFNPRNRGVASVTINHSEDVASRSVTLLAKCGVVSVSISLSEEGLLDKVKEVWPRSDSPLKECTVGVARFSVALCLCYR